MNHGTPAAAVETWLAAWQREDWSALAVASQPTCVRGWDDPAARLADAYGPVKLVGWRLSRVAPSVRRVPVPVAVTGSPYREVIYADVRVTLDTEAGGRRATRRGAIRVVRETPDGMPAPILADRPGGPVDPGLWWVNPVSVIRALAGEGATHAT